jgi:GNAT superfamily N-acetyltransferase
MEAAGVQLSARARAWRRNCLRAVCDVLEPWEHGTVARATRYPSYFGFNLVTVERDPRMAVDQLVAFSERALDGLPHRHIEFESYQAGQALRAGFETLGWRTECVLWMRHEGTAKADPGNHVEVREVPYDRAHRLRVSWHQEDFPGVDASMHFGSAREVALARNARVLGAGEEARPIAYAQIESGDTGAEISDVYVHPDHRGRGIGTALTRVAIATALPTSDLWIAADDEDRPKHLYARLGFRPVWREMQFLRLP